MIKKIPKVLIFGQSFNKNTGGGITLSNLFYGWPKNNIAVANIGHGMRDIDFSVCKNYYLLGKKEYKWVFPFNKLQRQFESGVVTPLNNNNITTVTVPQGIKQNSAKNYRKIFIEKVFFPFLDYMGFSPKMSKLILSPDFKIWLNEYQPDVIYVQVSNLESINFVRALKKYTNKPLILHMMDDWPSVISTRGPLKNYWHNKIDKALRDLLKSCSLLMSISDAMSEEYQHRFGLKFTSFHNPININDWLPYSKNNWAINNTFKILYTGRIGTANTETIKKIAVAVDNLCKSGLKISLDIFSPNIHSERARALNVFNGVNLKNIVPHSKIPALLPQYDLLVLPLDFDKKSVKFAKLSMPTKASEFMVSGTPVLVFAPKQTALAKYADKLKWAYLVTDTQEAIILNAFKELYTNEELRAKLGQRAKSIAIETEDARLIREKFKEAISSVQIVSEADAIKVY